MIVSSDCVSHALRFRPGRKIFAALASAGLLSAHAAAQETIRPSAAGAEDSAARNTAILPQNFNVRFGPLTGRISTAVGLEFNDNVGLAEVGRQSDLIIRPQLGLATEWRITPENTFHLNVGLGFAQYVEHSNLSSRTILLDPGTALQFNVYVGDVLRLNFHDQISIVQNPIDEPNLSNVANFDRLENSVGLAAVLDFDQLQFVFGYDHFDYYSVGSEFSFLNHREEQFSASSSVRLSDAVTAGVDGSFALIDYAHDYNNNGQEWSAGPFVEATLSPYCKVRATAGAQGMTFDSSGTSGDTSDFHGWYGNIAASQRLNAYWSHSLAAGHEAQLGLTTNYVNYTYLRYAAQWQMNMRTHVGFQGFVEEADESGGAAQNAERSFRWGAGVTVGWTLSRHLSLTLTYNYVNKNSDLPLRSYDQDSTLLTAVYQF
jgi:hypothetical protein